MVLCFVLFLIFLFYVFFLSFTFDFWEIRLYIFINNRDKDTEYDTEIDEKPGQKNEEHKSHYTKKNQEEYLEKLCPD